MDLFKCKNKYKLVLSWEDIEYKSDNEAFVKNPVFSGPAMSLASQINDGDTIDLDITSQHILVLGYWDIINFKWSKVLSQDSSQAVMDFGIFTSPEMTKVRLFESDDILLIDTENHEDEKHQYNLVYKTVVAKKDESPYNYKSE